jgi:hypothetical protein
MDHIRQQVARARRRLWVELFLARLVKCLFASLLVGTIAVAVPRLAVIDNLPAQWDAWWLGGSLAAGLLVALAWTWLRGRSELDAAIEIDRRFDLKERVASSLSLPAAAAETPAGRALLADAERAVRRLEIDERFRIRMGRTALLPLAPAFAALALVMFVDNEQAQSSITRVAAVSPQALENSTKALRKRLVEIAKKTPKKDLKDAQALLLQMEKEVEKLASKKDVDRKQALMKFNNLAQQLADRRQQAGDKSELKKQFAGMKDFGQGPAEKMLASMKSGDWDQAKQEMQKLQQQLASGKLDDAAKKQLAQQLKQLEQQLAEAAAKRSEAIEQLKQQIEQKKKDGQLAEAGELQEKLDRMMKQQQQASQMQQMAQQVAEAQESLEKGDKQAAAAAMSEMMKQLDQMQSEAEAGSEEAEMLDMAMAELEMSKDAMACSECEGAGCAKCQGGMSQRRMPQGRNGPGIGSGSAMGARPEDPTNPNFRDTRVRQDPTKGPAIITGEAEGPTVRGDVREEIKEEMAAEESDDADALVIEQLPRTQRENAEDYFNRLRDGD